MTKFLSREVKIDFRDVLIVPKKTRISSRKEVSLQKKITFNNNVTWTGVPIVSSNMDTVTNLDTFNILKQHNYISCFPKHFNKIWSSKPFPIELVDTDHYMLSCGTTKDDCKTMINLLMSLHDFEIHPKFLCIDVANGYIQSLQDTCCQMRELFPNMIITAGNVVTPDLTRELIQKCGVDIVKVGIGSGAVCETRLKAGVGYPQLSAVMECSQAAHEAGGFIMSDGGIVNPCDIVKAFVGGSDFVMCGSIFAGHNESPGETIHGGTHKSFYGMSSSEANQKYNGGMNGYRTSEGKSVAIPIKGSIDDTLCDISGSIRSACAYTNCEYIDQLRDAKFIQVNHHHNTSLS